MRYLPIAPPSDLCPERDSIFEFLPTLSYLHQNRNIKLIENPVDMLE